MKYNRYKIWFYAAALYNLVWGSVAILFPSLYFDLIGMDTPKYLTLWSVIGMFVLVYAPPYFWAGRHPERYPHFILIGLLGKVLGPIGFVFSVLNGQLPVVFGLTILTNDLIWWPAFVMYLRQIIKDRGLKVFLLGDIIID